MQFKEQVIEHHSHPDGGKALLRADIEDSDHVAVTGASSWGARIAWLDGGSEPTDVCPRRQG